MWRAFFMAVGINLLIIGAQFLIVEKVIISKPADRVARQEAANGSGFTNAAFSPNAGPTVSSNRKTFKPKDWMPWCMLGAGTVIVIYTRNYKNPN